MSCGAVGLARTLPRSLMSHPPQRGSRSLLVASLFDVAHVRRSQSREFCGIVDLVSMRNATSRHRQVRRALALASSSCSPLAGGAALLAVMGRLPCDRRAFVWVCSALAGAHIFGGRRLRLAPLRLSGWRGWWGVVARALFALAHSPYSPGAAPAIVGCRSSAWWYPLSHVRAHARRSLALVSSVGVGLLSRCARRRLLLGGLHVHTRAAVVPWWPLGHQGTLKTQQTHITFH